MQQHDTVMDFEFSRISSFQRSSACPICIQSLGRIQTSIFTAKHINNLSNSKTNCFSIPRLHDNLSIFYRTQASLDPTRCIWRPCHLQHDRYASWAERQIQTHAISYGSQQCPWHYSHKHSHDDTITQHSSSLLVRQQPWATTPAIIRATPTVANR